MKKKLKRNALSIGAKIILFIVGILIVFTISVIVIGYNGFTDTILTQYTDGAFHTADIAALEIDSDNMKDYVESKGTTEEYKAVLNKLGSLCDSSGATFIYVIQPDLKDYNRITFLFSTINKDSGYKKYAFGYVQGTTNDEYKRKYKRLYEGKSERELVMRDEGYIETDAHITAMIPLKDKAGNATAILCVQRQMDTLVSIRHNYISKIIFLLIIAAAAVVILQSLYLNRICFNPISIITDEAIRFASENTKSKKSLKNTISNKDEIGVLAESIDQMEERILKYVNDLTEITAEKERINTELLLAARIQSNMLPNIFPPFPERSEFDIFASMDPAKVVGGDFYDYFLIDSDHLCLVIADVSGKGVPAALFMMSSKIILSNFAKMGKSPAEILTSANSTICSNNNEDMFVTVWLGILEISTGKLTAANAGHENPILMQPDGKFEIYQDKHGFVLGGFDGLLYKEYEFYLKPGAKIFLYTDGVVEATDKDNELFGTIRLLSTLNENKDLSPNEIIKDVISSVDNFVNKAEQFDDLTMMCFEYKGIKNE